MTGMKRWRGLKALVQDAVEHGSRAVERVHMETARRPFAVLELVPGLGEAAHAVHVIHDVCTTTTYGMVRVVNRVAGAAIDQVFDAIEAHDARPSSDCDAAPMDGSQGGA